MACAPSSGRLEVLRGSSSGPLVRLPAPACAAPRRRHETRQLQVRAQLDPASLIASAGKAVWGKGLPPGALVQVARESWTTLWKVMMSQLAPSNSSGAYQRPASAFRDTIAPEHPSFTPEAGRYALYTALSCPWAHRTLIVHRLKGLEGVVPLVIARPGGSGLWELGPGPGVEGGPASGGVSGMLGPTADTVNGCLTVKEVYQLQAGGYDGRATVPMLWDTKTRRPANNESADIIGILNSQFNEWAANPSLDLAPPGLQAQMEEWDKEIYENVNNGVYCCGFATSQAAYNAAVDRLFGTLDKIEAHLATSRYLCGDRLTLSDVRLFTTLVRFDVAYYPLFKCSKRKIVEYKNLFGFLRDIYQMDGVAQTCNLAGVGQSYFGSLFPLNPGGIVPACPSSALPEFLCQPHDRAQISQVLSVSG